MSSLSSWFLNSLWKRLCRRDYFSFVRASCDVQNTQKQILLNILKANEKTTFGKRHDFQSIYDIAGYQKKVPLSRYASYADDIARIKAGRNRVLTSDPIVRLHATSGSTTASKEIPFNRTLLRQFQMGIRTWIYDLLHHHKELLYGKVYWSITPSMAKTEDGPKERLSGFGEDLEYFGWAEKWVLKHLVIVPYYGEPVKDTGLFYYLTLLKLVHEKNIRLFSVWSPMLLVIMMRKLDDLFPLLLGDLKSRSIAYPCEISGSEKKRIIKKIKIKRKRVVELETVLRIWEKDKSQKLPNLIWPNLYMVSCWADGSAANMMSDLKSCFQNVQIQPKGLLATEGIVSVPVTLKSRSCASVLSVNSHFYEFREVGNDTGSIQRPLFLAHELSVGRKYNAYITTGGGFYRYNLQDIVEVVGKHGDLPCLRFIGRDDLISDVTGEKLNASHVEKILEGLFKKINIVPGFYLLAPERFKNGVYAYVLFISRVSMKGETTALIDGLESGLRQNYHYDYCRRLGQLERVKVEIVDQRHGDLMDQYITHKALKGKRLGDIKHAALDNALGWSEVFNANRKIVQAVTNES